MKAEEYSIVRPPAPAQPGKYLIFGLGAESYGIAIMQVREIIRPTAITPVPQMPSHVQGVINLRGKIIPVLDLRNKFGLATPATNNRSCIIVVQTKTNQSATLTGLLVDSVEEVIHLKDEDIEAAPDFGRRLDSQLMLGIAKAGSTVKILLDLERLVADEMLAQL